MNANETQRRFNLYKCCMNLCPCTRRPCSHFTTADTAAMSRSKKTWIRKIIERDFNFAVFVRHVLAMRGVQSLQLLSCIKMVARHCDVDVNQRDPLNGQTALHYAVRADCSVVVSHLLDHVNGLDTLALDAEGMPACAYDRHLDAKPTTRSNLPGKICVRSKKLFSYLFSDRPPPQRWSTSLLGSVEKAELQHMDPEKRHHLLTAAKDPAGNTILHLAAKNNKADLVKWILAYNDRTMATIFASRKSSDAAATATIVNDMAKVKNLKGKTPGDYCKVSDTFVLFRQPLKRKLYFKRNGNVETLWIQTFLNDHPELVRLLREPKSTTDNTAAALPVVAVHDLDDLINYVHVLSTKTMQEICRRVVDTTGSTLWHLFTIFGNKDDHGRRVQWYFDELDAAVINRRNAFGETPLHLAVRDEVKEYLLTHGAHPDCLDNRDRLASHHVMNLQCIAARNVALPYRKHLHGPLLDVVALHRPDCNTTAEQLTEYTVA